MYLIDEIKTNTYKRYELIENRIFRESTKYKRENLTEYIVKVYIHSDISLVHPEEYIIRDEIRKYLRKLLIQYYKYYIKNIINGGTDYIIKESDIKRYLSTQNSYVNKNYEWIKYYSELDISLEDYIINLYNNMNKLEVFNYSIPLIEDIYIFIAGLLDNIIDNIMVYKY